MRAKTIAVDLDGTLYHQTKWDRQSIGKLMKGAVRELQALKNDGWDIVIHTARIPEDWDFIEQILICDEVPYTKLWRGQGKPLADVYLDDRAITFDGTWDMMSQRINQWNPWYGDKFLRPAVGSEDEELTKDR